MFVVNSIQVGNIWKISKIVRLKRHYSFLVSAQLTELILIMTDKERAEEYKLEGNKHFKGELYHFVSVCQVLWNNLKYLLRYFIKTSMIVMFVMICVGFV